MITSGALCSLFGTLPASSEQAVPWVLRPRVRGSQARGILGGPFEKALDWKRPTSINQPQFNCTSSTPAGTKLFIYSKSIGLVSWDEESKQEAKVKQEC